MELVSLELEHFGRIGSASIAFRPGLNVLHGANEVGKSSIARAIRFALLLPSSSSFADPWIPWSGGGEPTVILVFKTGPTEYFRVKKIFGTATATLERSSDGAGWAHLARGRDVEGRVRNLLQWGIPEPGGAKGTKGLPDSFLASALLADQDAVLDVFKTDLSTDAGDSGRAQIRAAVQAIAQDPLFRSCLDAAQSRVDDAFTPAGHRKRGASAPFQRIADEVKQRQSERDAADQAAHKARALAQHLEELQSESAEAASCLHDASAGLGQLEDRRARQAALDAAAAARKTGQALVDAVLDAQGKIAAADAVLGGVEPRLPGLRKAEEDARKTFEAATARASGAREKRKAELAQEETAIVRAREALRVRREVAETGARLRKADELQRQGDQQAADLASLEVEIKTLTAIEPWRALRAAQEDLAAAEKREQEAGQLLATAQDLRRRAAETWPTAQSSLLPDDEALDHLRGLRGKVDLAAAKLEVGLSIELRGAHSATVSVDGGPSEDRVPPLAVDAKRVAQITLPGGVELTVRGGQPNDRAAADRLRHEWDTATSELFQRVGVGNLDSLVSACRSDGTRKAEADALVKQAEARDLEHARLGHPAADKERLAASIVEFGRNLDGSDLPTIQVASEAHGSRARIVLGQKTAGRATAHDALSKNRAQEAALRERITASSPTVTDPEAELAACDTEARDLDAKESHIGEERKVLEAPRGKKDALQDQAEGARKELEEAVAKIAAAMTERDTWGARLEERRQAAAGVDIETLTHAETAASVAAAHDGVLVDQEAVDKAADAEQFARLNHERLVGKLRTAEGTLLASGGIAAKERVTELEIALHRAHEKQSALEDDYEAWRLLRETLVEAERTQATHLGNVLAPDIVVRFRELAGTRYDGITLGPHLRLESIETAGGSRGLDRLSIGTQEQLSTLFRMCLAEKLRSALLLDDQLVQSDPDRLRWFRGALRRTAATGVQVVVLTCRPDDYLEPVENPAPHVVELGQP